MGFKLITAATTEPIDVSELKGHSRIPVDEDDTLILSYIKAARGLLEAITKRKFITQTWEYYRNGFPYDDPCFALPFPPITSLTFLKYLDTSGNTITMGSGTDYITDLISEPARISVPYTVGAWPLTQYGVPNTVWARFVCGFGGASAVPEEIKQAIRMLAAHYYENREAFVRGAAMNEVPEGIMSLVAQYRIFSSVDDDES